MSDFAPSEKGIPIRMPSVANLMIDSGDAIEHTNSPYDITFQKNNNIMNGFFTRIATTEVVMEWNTPNILGGTQMVWTITQSGVATPFTIDGPAYDVLMTVADLVNFVVNQLNDLNIKVSAGASAGDPAVFTASYINGLCQFALTNNGDNDAVSVSTMSGVLAETLRLPPNGGIIYGTRNTAGGPGGIEVVRQVDLRLYRYIDFVSNQLTYAQDVKDNSSGPIARDVLCRWYMAWDNPPTLDSLGFPILMGYTPFVARRLFNPAKQIKWESNLPVGNISVQLYNEDGALAIALKDTTQWLMTLQLSEV